MIRAIRLRRSHRTFLDKKVSERKLKEILLAAMYAPNSWGTRPWEFIVVRDDETLKTLSGATRHSSFVKNASLSIVIIYDETKGGRFREDSSICAEHIHLEATNQGLSSCFVQIAEAGEPRGSAEPLVKNALGIPEKYRVQCIMPIGYPKKALKEHTKAEFDRKKIHLEGYGRQAAPSGQGKILKRSKRFFDPDSGDL